MSIYSGYKAKAIWTVIAVLLIIGSYFLGAAKSERLIRAQYKGCLSLEEKSTVEKQIDNFPNAKPSLTESEKQNINKLMERFSQ